MTSRVTRHAQRHGADAWRSVCTTTHVAADFRRKAPGNATQFFEWTKFGCQHQLMFVGSELCFWVRTPRKLLRDQVLPQRKNLEFCQNNNKVMRVRSAKKQVCCYFIVMLATLNISCEIWTKWWHEPEKTMEVSVQHMVRFLSLCEISPLVAWNLVRKPAWQTLTLTGNSSLSWRLHSDRFSWKSLTTLWMDF